MAIDHASHPTELDYASHPMETDYAIHPTELVTPGVCSTAYFAALGCFDTQFLTYKYV